MGGRKDFSPNPAMRAKFDSLSVIHFHEIEESSIAYFMVL